MPYIARDHAGRINVLLYQPVAEITEFLPSSHPEVLAFLAESNKGVRDLDRLVGEVTGVVEDVVGALLSKNSLSITDLSPAAQKFVRQDKLQGKPLGALLSDEGEVRLP